MFRSLMATALAVVLGSPALAGSEPLYQPAPAWVAMAPLPAAGTAPVWQIYDVQQRLENGRVWIYNDIARRIANAEQLGQQTSLTLPWVPDQGDLIVHRLEIVRAGKVIDVLAGGQKFEVLRREANLEQQIVTGILTATLNVEGLQVGDTLRIAFSTTTTDTALAGKVQSAAVLFTQPLKLGFGRVRASWPRGQAPRFQSLIAGIEPERASAGGYDSITYALPLTKPADIPPNAPGRFKRPALLELSSFASWEDVSRTMAPLYATRGTIAADSPLKAEVAAIMAATPDPVARAARALQLVQDKVRYLAVQMNGGNYRPQSPAQTWTARYGDCKAKTLLLLALLHEMGIAAEPVLAHIELGDLASVRLPSPLVFNHVLVRAEIGGESLWLDGTGSGTRLADIRDTPPFFNVLPLRAAGATLMPLKMHADARAALEMDVRVDESAAIDVPPVMDVKLTLSGRPAVQFNAVASQLGPKETHDLIASLVTRQIGDARVGAVAASSDADAGTVTVTASAVANSGWAQNGQRLTRQLDPLLGRLNWNVDRSRAAWSQIPVMTSTPEGVRYRQTVKLTDAGRGMTLDGTPAFDGSIVGEHLVRTAALAGGTATMTERMDSAGIEIPASAVGAERDRLAKAKASAPVVVAPTDVRRRWDIDGRDPPGATQIKAAEAVFAANIAVDGDDVDAWLNRARFRRTINDLAGARADFAKAIEVSPSVAAYLGRADLAQKRGDLVAAQKDAESARELDPADLDALNTLTQIMAERGQLAEAIALVDERIALGGEQKPVLVLMKGALEGEFGDPAAAIATLDAEIAATPGRADLLNSRCYVKAQRSLDLDNALKDCTRAIELAGSSAGILDSRGLVWFRMGKLDEARADLDSALELSPDIPESRFLRAVIHARQGRAAEARRDLAIARRLDPRVDVQFARYGIKAPA